MEQFSEIQVLNIRGKKMCDLHKVPNGPFLQVRSIEGAFARI